MDCRRSRRRPVHRAFVAKTIEAAINQVPNAAAVGIDMPIGLPEPREEERPADEMARALVGPRWQSIFMTPSARLAGGGNARASQRARCRAPAGTETLLGLRPPEVDSPGTTGGEA